MDVRQLPDNLKVRLRSATNINTIIHCVLELVSTAKTRRRPPPTPPHFSQVLNSLDAKASSVAVRVDLHAFRVQVVDNGSGIPATGMEKVGLQYMTNRCHRTRDIEGKFRFHGYRGESLFSVANLSTKLEIASRFSEATYRATICGGHRELVEDKRRPSKGTTVTVHGFLHNQPVRRKRINPAIDVEEIKKCVTFLSVINPNVSFSLRDDAVGNVVFKCHRSESVLQSFAVAYDISVDDVHRIKVNKGKLKVAGLISTRTHGDNKLQLIYVNKRPVRSRRMRRAINATLLGDGVFKVNVEVFETAKGKVHPIYVVNVECPHSEVSYSFDSIYSVVFDSFDAVSKLLERAVGNFLRRQTCFNSQKSHGTIEVKSSLGVKRRPSSAASDDGAGVVHVHDENKENEHELSKRARKKIRRDTVAVPKSKKSCRNTVSKGETGRNASDEGNAKFDSHVNDDNAENGANIFDEVAPPGSSQISGAVPQNFSENIFNDRMDGKEVIMDMFIKSVEFYSQKLKKQVSKTTFADESPGGVEKNVDERSREFAPSVRGSNRSLDDFLRPLGMLDRNDNETPCDFVPPTSKCRELNDVSKTCSRRASTEDPHEEKSRNVKNAANFNTGIENGNDSGELFVNILHDVSFSNDELKTKRMKNLNAVANVIINKKLNAKPVERDVQSSSKVAHDDVRIIDGLNDVSDFTFNSSHIVAKKQHETHASVVNDNQRSDDKERFDDKNKSLRLSCGLERDTSMMLCNYNDAQLQENRFVVPKRVDSAPKRNKFNFDADTVDVNPPRKFDQPKSIAKTDEKSTGSSGAKVTRSKPHGAGGTRDESSTQQNEFNFDVVDVQRTCHDNDPGAKQTVKSTGSRKHDFDVGKFVINSGRRCDEFRRTKSFDVGGELIRGQKVVHGVAEVKEMTSELFNGGRKGRGTSDVGRKFNFDANVAGSVKHDGEGKTFNKNLSFAPTRRGGSEICQDVMKRRARNSPRSHGEAYERVGGTKRYDCDTNTRRGCDGGGFRFYFDELAHDIHVNIETKQLPSSHGETSAEKRGGSVVCIEVKSNRAGETVDISKRSKENPSSRRTVCRTEKAAETSSPMFNLCSSGNEFDRNDVTFKSHYVTSAKAGSTRRLEGDDNDLRDVKKKKTEIEFYNPRFPGKISEGEINNGHGVRKPRSAREERNGHDKDKVGGSPDLADYKLDFNFNEKRFGKDICNVYAKDSDDDDIKQQFYKSLFATENINGNDVDMTGPFTECNQVRESAVEGSARAGTENMNEVRTTRTEGNRRCVDDEVNSYNSFVEGLVNANRNLVRNTPSSRAANSSNFTRCRSEGGNVSKYFERNGEKPERVTKRDVDAQTSFYFDKSVFVRPRDKRDALRMKGTSTDTSVHRSAAANGALVTDPKDHVENHNPASSCEKMEPTRGEPTGDDVENVCSSEEDGRRDEISDRAAGIDFHKVYV